MNILVACEESQEVTIQLRKLGHEAFSCDLEECSGPYPEWHIKDDVLKHLNKNWDMMIGFPPCTFLTVTANRWLYHPDDKNIPVKKRRAHPLYPERKKDREKAIEFFMKLINAPIPHIAIENPVGIMSSRYRKPDQIIEPFWFGDRARKRTCLWLHNLPLLTPTDIVIPKVKTLKDGKTYSCDYLENVKRNIPGESSKIRSKTYPGIAKAMANQWAGNGISRIGKNGQLNIWIKYA